MSEEVENVPGGYPGFRVRRPPGLMLSVALLKRIAFHKISDITLFSASFGGESYLFEPWLTAVVDYGDGMACVGVYRTEDALSEIREGHVDPRVPTLCLRRSEWDRDLDWQQASEADDLVGYLAAGPQVTNTFVFGNRTTHPGIDEVMNQALSVLARGISVVPAGQRDTEWEFLEVQLGDDALTCTIQYSPLTARSEPLEAVLPTWIGWIDELLQRDGLSPEGDIDLSIKWSVPERVSAPLRRRKSSGAPTPQSVGAVVVHDAQATAPVPADSASGGIHVDFPPSRWAELRHSVGPGVVDIDVRAIPDLASLTGALAPGTTDLTPALSNCPAHTIGLTSFEQLWVKNRTTAEQLLRDLPTAINAAQADGRTLKVMLIDLSSTTVGAVLDALRQAPTADLTAELPVFRYPPAP